MKSKPCLHHIGGIDTIQPHFMFVVNALNTIGIYCMLTPFHKSDQIWEKVPIQLIGMLILELHTMNYPLI